MKKFKILMTMMAIALVSFTFTSCDEDEDIAYTLEGTWVGDLHVTSNWNGRDYYATESYVCFDKDPYEWASGTGYWVDYYSDASWDYIANHIEWNVDNGVINVYFVEDHYDVKIYDYRLNDGYFEGRIITDDGKNVSFRLRKTSSRNWRDYNYEWDYNVQPKGLNEVSRASASKTERPQRVFRLKE